MKLPGMKSSSKVFLSILATVALCGIGWSEDDATKKALEAQKALFDAQRDAIKAQYELERQGLENQKDMLNLQNDILKARFPMGEGQGITPDFTAENFELMHHIQTSRALKHGLGAIVAKLPADAKNVIVVTNVSQLELLSLRHEMLRQLTNTIASYGKLGVDDKNLVGDQNGFLIAKSFLSNAQDIFNFFATSTKLSYKKVDITERELVCSVAPLIKNEDRKVFLPLLPLNNLKSTNDLIVTKMGVLAGRIGDAGLAVERLKDKPSAEDKAKSARIQAWLEPAKTLMGILNSKGDEEKLRLVDRLALLSWHDELKNNKGTYTVLFGVEEAGGTTRVVKGTFNSGSLSFSGGLVLSYMFLDESNNYLQSGVIYRHQGWQNVRDESGEIPIEEDLPQGKEQEE